MIPSWGVTMASLHVLNWVQRRVLARSYGHSVEKAVRGLNRLVCMTEIIDAMIEMPATIAMVRSPSCHAGVNWTDEPVVW